MQGALNKSTLSDNSINISGDAAVLDEEVSISLEKRIIPKLGIKALIVDDNSSNALLAKYFLEKWNIETIIASDGYEALKSIHEIDYNFILMDIMMPGIDGFEITKIIRNMHGNKNHNVPIIAITGANSNFLNEHVIEAGMNDVLLKPFNPEELYNKIVKHLSTNE